MSGVDTASNADIVREGITALRRLSTHLMGERSAQFSHRFEHSDEAYVVAHFPDRCPTCSWLDAIERGLFATLEAES